MKNNNTNKILSISAVLSVATAVFIGGCSSTTFPEYKQAAAANAKETVAKAEMGVKLAADHNIQDQDISTHMRDGILQVAGFVDDEADLHKVSNKAESMKKDNRVINNVKVLPRLDDKQDEKQLISDIKQKLEESGFATKDITVQVRNGNVILSGFMNQQVNLGSVANVVKETSGVKHVDNYLLYQQKNKG